MVRRRRATHAGSWYDARPDVLRRSLTTWLSEARAANPSTHPVHAVIAPHAGFSYSGSTAAYAYSAIDPSRFSRVFVLGPSHHVYLNDRCAVSDAHVLDTPLGELPVDRHVVERLVRDHCRFVRMKPEMDEAEHSIEMHLPYIRHVFHQRNVMVVPIVVGSLSEEKERQFGAILSTWLGDGETLFVISSDFCHWGSRFGYTLVDRDAQSIWQSIENLDHEGMQLIERSDHAAFCSYQRRTENTVCGRHPIGVLITALTKCASSGSHHFTTRFVRYVQSSRCMSMSDSSVSYATALIQATPKSS